MASNRLEELQKKIEKAAKKKVSGPLLEAVMASVNEDLVLPILDLCPKCTKVSITTDDEEVSLQVGPRDWQWDRATLEMVGCGTMLS